MKKMVLALLIFTSTFTINASAQTKATKQQWIREITLSQWGRQPDAWELVVEKYNGGNFTSKPELIRYFNEFMGNMGRQGLLVKLSATSFNGNLVAGLFQNGNQIAASLISNDGASIVASGGGNIVASGGGNIVGTNGGNIIASGGGNITVTPSMPGFSLGGLYGVQSNGRTTFKASGSSALIIR